MKIPFRDLSIKDTQLKKKLLGAVNRVLTHGRLNLGPEVEQFEKQIAKLCQKRYAVGVNSGSDALYLALRSLGIGPGNEVITTPLSWIATVNAIVLCGATPVFVDISDDLNINADLIEMAITPKTKVILPVHFAGKLCDMPRITKIAQKHRLFVVEDAAQAFGARIDGSFAGSFGDVNCLSMNPMKVLGAFGEAGAVVTDDKNLYKKLIALRYAGTVEKGNCYYPSLNGKLDTIQSAMLLVNLKYCHKKTERRREIAKTYTQALRGLVECPREDGSYHVYYTYTVISRKRDDLEKFLLKKGIETRNHYPILMPYQNAYRKLFKCNIPVAEKLVKKIIALPNEDRLSLKEINYIIKSIKEFFQKAKA